jgi:hypothetical protein
MVNNPFLYGEGWTGMICRGGVSSADSRCDEAAGGGRSESLGSFVSRLL